MAYRKRTLRQMLPVERKYAELLTELDSVLRRLRNLRGRFTEHEVEWRAAVEKELESFQRMAEAASEKKTTYPEGE